MSIKYIGVFYKDLQILVIQHRLNYFTKKYNIGGSVKMCIIFNNLIKKAEQLGCLINITFYNGGSDNINMRVNLIKE